MARCRIGQEKLWGERKARSGGISLDEVAVLVDWVELDCQTASKSFQGMECAPAGGQNERIGLTPLAGLPEDGSHDEASITQRRVQAASC